MSQKSIKPLNDEQLAKLGDFRDQIDTIDDKIIELLIKRIGIVQQVGKMKYGVNPGQCPLRPGREADMVRRVSEKFEGTPFSPAAAAAMWRLLIGASTAVEGPLTISVYTPEKDDTLYWSTREYFGPFMSITRHTQVTRVIGDVVDGKAAIGVIPNLQQAEANPWWTSLLEPNRQMVNIFAHVPYTYYETPTTYTPSALAIGCIEPEATKDDVSIIVLNTDYNVSQHRIQTAFTQANLKAQWLSIANLQSTSRHHLIELKGFVNDKHEGMQSFLASMKDAILGVYYLGAYAVPFTLRYDNANEKPAVYHAGKSSDA